MIKKVTFIFFLSLAFKANAQLLTNEKKMEWFGEAKLGIFIHWGIYSVNGISESWSFFNNYLNHDAYMKQLNGFTASNYDPTAWVKLIKESGAKYAVITSKHHDGVALWNTKSENAISTLASTPAKRDVLSPFVKALKVANLKTGIYFSLPDWSHKTYDVFTREKKRYLLKEEPERWAKFLDYYQLQLSELSNQFNPDLMWFDGDWEHTSAEWQTDKVRQLLKKKNPDIIINSRLDANGDYETPEQGIPVLKPSSKYWELCYTINDSWGFQPFDLHYKSTNMIIQTLVDCISMGGNLLLNIGPKADGTIPLHQVNVLKGLGRWTSKHAEAIYKTTAGLPSGYFNGKTSLSPDRKTLYLYASQIDKNGFVVNNIKSEIKSISVVGSPERITHKKINNTQHFIQIPAKAYDPEITVIKITFDEPIELIPIETTKINLSELIASKNESNYSKINKIAAAIADGNNPFQNSQLTSDGLGYEFDSQNPDKTLNRWITKHAEALYQTGQGIPTGHFDGKTALSKDKQTLYLFVSGTPNGPIAIKGLKNQISRIRIVGEGTMLAHSVFNKLYWSKVPGIVYIDVPKERLDGQLTVIAVLLDAPIDLYREKIGAVESN